MQADRHGVEVVVEQIGVGVQCDLRGRPSIRCSASTFTPADTASDAHVWRRSCGVIFCTLAFLTAAWNHPVDDFGRWSVIAVHGHYRDEGLDARSSAPTQSAQEQPKRAHCAAQLISVSGVVADDGPATGPGGVRENRGAGAA